MSGNIVASSLEVIELLLDTVEVFTLIPLYKVFKFLIDFSILIVVDVLPTF